MCIRDRAYCWHCLTAAKLAGAHVPFYITLNMSRTRSSATAEIERVGGHYAVQGYLKVILTTRAKNCPELRGLEWREIPPFYKIGKTHTRLCYVFDVLRNDI